MATISKTLLVEAQKTYELEISLKKTYHLIVDLYSAASDTLSYTDDNGAQTVTTDSTGKATGVNITITQPSQGVDPTITFTSSVAKDPDNLSNNYSKSITVTSQTTAIYVMPDACVYWWGWKISDITNTANQPYSNAGYSNQGHSLTFSTNYATIVLATGTKSNRTSTFDTPIDLSGKTYMKTIKGNQLKSSEKLDGISGSGYICVLTSRTGSGDLSPRIYALPNPRNTFDTNVAVIIPPNNEWTLQAIWFE